MRQTIPGAGGAISSELANEGIMHTSKGYGLPEKIRLYIA